MISLLITCLLSFFCCSSVPFDTLDHTKEIEVREQEPKSVIFNNDECVLSLCDLFAGDTNYFLINGLIEDGYTIFQLDNTTTYTLDLPTDGRLFDAFNQDLANAIQVNTLRITKRFLSSIVVDGNTFYRCHFKLTFYCVNDQRFAYDLVFSGTNFYVRPLVTMWVGNVVNTTSIATDSLGYIESNDYGSNKPYVKYFLPSYSNYNNIPSTAAYSQGYDDGYTVGNGSGYQSGYNQGLIDGSTYDDTALTIFTGFIEVGLLPVNIFLQILNFEVFGINIAGFVSALLTISIVIIVVRVITGKKDD